MTESNYSQPPEAGYISALERAALLSQRPGFTIWFTGLSAAGKSTIARALEHALLHRPGSARVRAYRLDGDNARHGLNRDLGFDRGAHAENVRRAGEVARLLADAGAVPIVAFIAPFAADRAATRERHAEVGLGFVEVFVDAPLEVAEARDPKGLYRTAREGVITDFTGISSPYEPPESPDVHVKTDQCSVEDAVKIIVGYLEEHDYIARCDIQNDV